MSMNKKIGFVGIAVLMLLVVGLIGCTEEESSPGTAAETIPSVKIYSDFNLGLCPLEVSLTYKLENFTRDVEWFLWGFGDGHQSVSRNCTHTYETVGTYDVTLLVCYIDPINDEGGLSDNNSFTSNTITITVEPVFKISGKITNNYNQAVDVDYSVYENYLNWEYYAPTVNLKPSEEKEFSFPVKAGYSEYMIQAQWFYPGTNTEGTMWDYAFFSNPANDDIIYNIEIERDGGIEISNPFDPKIIDSTYDNSIIIGGQYVFGVIENPSSTNINDVRLSVTFYDASNNIVEKVESSEWDYTNHIKVVPSTIESGETAVFFCDPIVSIGYFDHYDVKVTGFETTTSQTNWGYDGLIFKDKGINIYDDWQGTRGNFYGALKNNGPKVVDWLRVAYTIYNSNGKIIYCELKTWDNYKLPIYSGEETSIYEVINRGWFDVHDISSQEDISSYEIILEYYTQ